MAETSPKHDATPSPKPPDESVWFFLAKWAGIASSGSIIGLILLGYGMTLSVEWRFDMNHAALLDSSLDLIDLGAIAVAAIIPRIAESLTDTALYIHSYQSTWHILVFGLLVAVLVHFAPWEKLRRAKTPRASQGSTTAQRKPSTWAWLALVVVSPLLPVVGVAIILVASSMLAMVPVLGMVTGAHHINEWVIKPNKCSPLKPLALLQNPPKRASGEVAEPAAQCVALRADGEEVARGRVVFMTSKSVILLNPHTGSVQRHPTTDVVIEVVSSL